MMRRGNYMGPRRVGNNAPRYLEEWEEYDPISAEYYDPNNGYTSGPGLHLPIEHLPYTIRTTGVPLRLFVSGIHPHTTEEGIRHIFSNYGHPLSVTRTRNRHNQPIAFVEFQTQAEADCAIIELDSKPPLNWEVCYAMARRVEDRFYQQLENLDIESELERQTPFGPIPIHGPAARQVPYPRPGFINSGSIVEVLRPSSASRALPPTDFPTCRVCGRNAECVCNVCKTRYCSQECQIRDWPTHRAICTPQTPPPALQLARHNHPVSRPPQNRREATGNGLIARGAPNIQIHLSNQEASIAPHPSRSVEEVRHGQQNKRETVESTNPHSYAIKGIHPIDQQQASVAMRVNSEAKPTSPEKRQTVSNGETVRQMNGRPGFMNPQNNGAVHPQTSTRSPTWKNNGTSLLQTCKSNGGLPSTNASVLNGNKNENNQVRETGTRPRNLPVGDGSPTTPVASPPKKAPQTNTSAVRVYAKEFSSSRNLKPLSDKPLQVSVCFAKSPHDFYIQYANFGEMLQKLMISIQTSAVQSDPLVNPIEGMPCLAVFAFDRQWYRAQVLRVMPDGIGIRFVDFGNTQKTPNNPDSFRMMEQCLAESPIFAINVKLADVVPVGGNTWSNEAKIKFKDLVENLNFTMEHVGIDGGVMCVRLKDSNGTDIIHRLEKENLVARARVEVSDELEFGLPSSNLPPPPQVMHQPQVRASSLRNVLPPQTTAATSIKSTTSQDAPKANVTLPPQLPAPISSPTRAAVRQTPTVQPRVPLTSVASAIRASTPVAVSEPTSGQKQGNSVVELLEPGMQSIFIVNDLLKSGGLAVTLIRNEEDTKVLEFDASTAETTPNFSPTVGSIVAALSPEHQQWFRAFIIKVLDSSFSVIYTDFGNFENVVSVKPIPSSFQHVNLGVKLTLFGDVSKEAEKYFDSELYLSSSNELKFISKEKDGSVVARLSKKDAPSCTVLLEPWASLLVQPGPVSVPPRDIPSLQWEPGFSCDVLPNVAEDVDRIYVQTVVEESIALSQAIQQKLNDYFPTGPKLTSLPPVGSCVAALFPEDGEVYRARITEVNGESITIFYIDYGNTSTVSLTDVRPLPDELYEHPAISKRVALANVALPPGTISTAVKDLLASWANQIVNLLIVPSSSGLTECVLNKDGVVLNELVSDLLDQQGKVEVKNVPQEMPQLEAAVPLQEEEIPVDNTLGEFSYEQCPFEEIPEKGDIQALILHTSSGPQLIMMRIASESLSAKLSQLEMELTDYAEGISRGHAPKLNEICIARFPDGKWYRAACLDSHDAARSVYTCIQVDNGHVNLVDIAFIRRIPKRFVEFLAFQAHQAILEGTENIPQILPELTARFAEILPENSVKTISVVRRHDDGVALIVRIPEVGAILSQESLI